MNDEMTNDVIEQNDSHTNMQLELERLTACYVYASGDDRRVIWAVLNKYVPFLAAEGLI